MQLWLAILLIVVAAIISGAVCFFMGIEHRKKIAEAEIGSAETEARRIVGDVVGHTSLFVGIALLTSANAPRSITCHRLGVQRSISIVERNL